LFESVTVKVNTPTAVEVAGFPIVLGGLVGSIQTAVKVDAGVAVNVTVFVLQEVEKVAEGRFTSLVIVINPVKEQVLTVLIAEYVYVPGAFTKTLVPVMTPNGPPQDTVVFAFVEAKVIVVDGEIQDKL